MNSLARIRDGISYGDLRWLDKDEAIAVYLVETRDGLAVVDPGPSSCRDGFSAALRGAGAESRDLRYVLLTHIHLDHAGMVGGLTRENPDLRVYVHERGAPHLADPARLLASALRIYGDDMARLWGDFHAVDRSRLHVLRGGERLTLGERKLRVAYTPGHAIHHIAFLEENEGLAWVGDVAGECSQHETPALPAAPPPDIDLPSWRASLDLVLGWRPEQLLLTHYGPVAAPEAHIAELWARVVEWSELIGASLDGPGSDEERATRFAEGEFERLARNLSEVAVRHLDIASFIGSWHGLARWVRKERARVSRTTDA
jgi:glyoxylase-like metal-dependent hydrolase (beta-lactamase superfamily II)